MKRVAAALASLALATSAARATPCPFDEATPVEVGKPSPCTGLAVDPGALNALVKSAACTPTLALLGGCEEARRVEREEATAAQNRCEAALFACETDFSPAPMPEPAKSSGLGFWAVSGIALLVAVLSVGGTALAYELR